MRWIHILAGLVAIASGFVALAASKGRSVHRGAGLVFVVAMLVMTGSAAVIAAFVRSNPGNVVAGLLTFYMVCTAFLAVRRHSPLLDRLAMWFAATVGLSSIVFAIFRYEEIRAGHGYPPPAFFVFGACALLFAQNDYRMIANGALTGATRLKRHLGRMCGSLLIATASLFMGQPQVFAGTALEAAGPRLVPVLAIVVAMIYSRRRLAGPKLPLLKDTAPGTARAALRS